MRYDEAAGLDREVSAHRIGSCMEALHSRDVQPLARLRGKLVEAAAGRDDVERIGKYRAAGRGAECVSGRTASCLQRPLSVVQKRLEHPILDNGLCVCGIGIAIESPLGRIVRV